MKKYVVTGVVKGQRVEITKPLSKDKATKTKNGIQRENKMAIPRYRWAKNLRIKEARKK